ncbi:MAG: hypothetical protein JRC92_01430 [Deltaproteobacteria bacterium]|nr:hypothetical protein [Deltaproteobacteria bacterium]
MDMAVSPLIKKEKSRPTPASGAGSGLIRRASLSLIATTLYLLNILPVSVKFSAQIADCFGRSPLAPVIPLGYPEAVAKLPFWPDYGVARFSRMLTHCHHLLRFAKTSRLVLEPKRGFTTASSRISGANRARPARTALLD